MLEAQRANLLPQTTTALGGTYGRDGTTDEILELTGRKPQTTWLFDDVLDASYELDLFGHVRRSIEAARDSSEAVAAARDDLRVTIAAETARAYGQICTLGEQLNVANQSLALVTQQAEITCNRFAAGGGSTYEVQRAQALAIRCARTSRRLLRKLRMENLEAVGKRGVIVNVFIRCLAGRHNYLCRPVRIARFGRTQRCHLHVRPHVHVPFHRMHGVHAGVGVIVHGHPAHRRSGFPTISHIHSWHGVGIRRWVARRTVALSPNNRRANNAEHHHLQQCKAVELHGNSSFIY